VLSLSNGVREMMMLIPIGDPAKWWQLQEPGGHEPFYQLADNIFLYAVDQKNLKEKGKTYLVDADPAIKADRHVKVARLQYDGNWNPEPAGWSRLSAALHNSAHIDLDVVPVNLGKASSGSAAVTIGADIRIAHLTGTTRFQLPPAAHDQLKAFVAGGGTLIVDAAGGSSEFASCAERELKSIFGSDADSGLAQPLSDSSPIFTLSGHVITAFDYRSYTRKLFGAVKGPQIRAITINGRLAVFYSRYDLSAGMVGEPRDGIVGYDPDTATAIMRNLVLFADPGVRTPVAASSGKRIFDRNTFKRQYK
jgi:hypothetical protein